MLEISGVSDYLQGLAVLYWVAAIIALVIVIWKVKRVPYKLAGVLIVIVVFAYLPITVRIEANKRMAERKAYASEAWAYFRRKCEAEAGEKIYKTFTDVTSVQVIRPLPPASETDLIDQFWYGSPYSNASTGDRAASAALVLASRTAPISFGKLGRGFDFVESPDSKSGRFIKYYYKQWYDERFNRHEYKPIEETIERPVSRFGISWEDISTPEDREYWVAGGRLRVVDLRDKSVVAERVGFIIEAGFGSRAGSRHPWQTAQVLGRENKCPEMYDWTDRSFVIKVLSPNSAEGAHGK